MWMINRLEDGQLRLLYAEDRRYGVAAGATTRWEDTLCMHMSGRDGAHVLLDVDQAPGFADAPIRRQLPIGAYIGLPLLRSDGSLFGSLCAIDPRPRPQGLDDPIELVEMMGAMLNTLLQAELRTAAEQRRAERLLTESVTDALTQLHNRRGWDRLLASEEERCRRYGHAAALLVVDLDGLKHVNDRDGHAAGDALLVGCAAALRQAARSIDVLARLGGDEFGLIAVECDSTGALALLQRVRATLAEAGIAASVGLSQRHGHDSLLDTWAEADLAMYQHKRARQAGRAA
jgi:diguanylate cyclase (GGDEF)-like protein